MQTYIYKNDGILPVSDCVLALGFFDGVHIAHRELLEAAKGIARKMGLPFGVFTFSSDGNVKQGVARIYTDREKIILLEEQGADFVVLAHFPSISGLSPEEFVNDVLVRDSSARVCVAGFNFRFGKGARGDADDLKNLLSRLGRSAVICNRVTREDVTVSSSLIRRLLSKGDIKRANDLLVEPYRIIGKVTRGNSRGRELGFPTLNTELSDERVIPRHGVYTSRVSLDGKDYDALTNVGTCPTLGERRSHAETHILNFSGDLYGREVSISLIDFLRDEVCFSNEEELIKQISLDREKARRKP